MNLEKLKNINTNLIAKNIKYFEEIDSTQQEAKRLILSNQATNGLVIIAEKQNLGIGTHGRKWYTGQSNNIAISIILFPNCNISKLTNLTVDIAKCIINSLKNLYNIELQIKEPNDIMCNNLKIGGILTQTVTKNEYVKTLIIGMGLNVNQLEFPEELDNIATSLKKEFLEIDFSQEDIIREFCENFELKYGELLKNN